MWSAAKREQKATSCSRAVGQMFKQTSNYLNSIWDLRGVPALESIALLLSPLSLSGPFRIHSRSVCLFSPFVFEAPAEDVVGRVPRKKQDVHFIRYPCWILVPLYVPPISTSNPFRLSLSLSFFPSVLPFLSVCLYLYLLFLFNFFDHRHYATTGYSRRAILIQLEVIL